MVSIGSEVVVCFMFVGLTMGAFITYILSRYAPDLPYTVVVFTLGILLAIGTRNSSFQVLGDSIIQWSTIESNLLLFTFIPALTFGEGMSVSVHHCRKTFISAFILAFPGCVLGTFLLAACLKNMTFFVSSYNWSWNLCYTLGAILSATDPVAVAALLKQVGISSRFTMLITQEALWNEGSAFVLFELFLDSLREHSEHDFSSVGIVKYFFAVIFLSPLIGIAFGLVTVFAMSFCSQRTKSEDTIVQVSLAISCAYLSFFVAQSLLFVSGIISCVSAGMVIAFVGTPLVLKPETMHSVWSTIEWVGNTLLFLLAGIILGSIEYEISGTDIASVVIVYLLLQVIRVLKNLLLYPTVKDLGYGISLKELAFLSWSGLRGAVGLALALVIQQLAAEHKLVISNEEGSRLLFLVGGVVTLTLVINATGAQRILYTLELVDDDSEEIRIMQNYARRRIQKKSRNLLTDLSSQLPAHDPEFLKEFCEVILLSGKLGAHATEMPAKGSSYPERDHANQSSQDPEDPAILELREDVLKSHTHRNMFNRGFEGLQLNQFLQSCTNRYDDSSQNNDSMINFSRAVTASSILVESDMDSPKMNVLTGREDFEKEAVASEGSSKSRGRRRASTFEGEVVEGLISTAHKSLKRATVSLQMQQMSSNANRRSTSFDHNHLTRRRSSSFESNTKLLEHVRIAFLDMVRSVYWRHIEEGKLPRNSAAAAYLLYSIDVGHDTVHTAGLQDWDTVENFLSADRYSWVVKTCSFIDSVSELMSSLFRFCFKYFYSAGNVQHRLVNEKGFLEKSCIEYFELHRSENAVLMLSSFIEAHEYTQRKIPHYLGEEEVADTPEEKAVVSESQTVVKKAKALLRSLDDDVISYHVSKQIARIVLHTQEDMIETFQEEGILRPRDADVLIAETHKTIAMIENEWLEKVWEDVMSVHYRFSQESMSTNRRETYLIDPTKDLRRGRLASIAEIDEDLDLEDGHDIFTYHFDADSKNSVKTEEQVTEECVRV